ncbi:hypothetical protein [Pseudomonas aeruginosa]|uniref:hypothetical protein n=1 Tax=Pseudomonas aeruginosa TaxID=287 RepID=UPI002E29C24B|nr:hypothetical protein [Pseudomonas aeruginosa]HCF4267613.1 hypothetical protein [Pseudomonas aeruginosa]
MLDINGKELTVDDKVYYATTHGTLQSGRIIGITETGLKVIGKGNKRELTIKNTEQQVLLHLKGHYLKSPKRRA